MNRGDRLAGRRTGDDHLLDRLVFILTNGGSASDRAQLLRQHDLATPVWERIGNNPDTGIGTLADQILASGKLSVSLDQQQVSSILVDMLAAQADWEAKSANPVRRNWLDLLIIGFVLALILTAIIRLATSDTADPVLAGQQQAASRTYAGPHQLHFLVIEFEDASAATTGFAWARNRVTQPPDGVLLSNVATADVPQVADQAAGYTAELTVSGFKLPTSFLLIQDGRHLRLMQAVAGPTASPLDPVHLAQQLFATPPYAGLAATPAAAADPPSDHRSGGLWTLLPAPQQLGKEYELVTESDQLEHPVFSAEAGAG